MPEGLKGLDGSHEAEGADQSKCCHHTANNADASGYICFNNSHWLPVKKKFNEKKYRNGKNVGKKKSSCGRLTVGQLCRDFVEKSDRHF